MYQPQNPAFEYFISFIKSLLSQIARGGRTNIKDYGDRFGYRWEYNERDDFFVYVAQFGHGLIAWGIVCGPGVERAADGPLAQMVWRPGAWGARDARARDESPESEQEGTVPKPDAERLSSSDSDYDPLPPELEQMMLSHEPSALGERLARELDAYTISFITSRGGLLSPAGSSTLVSVRGSKYVLTAGHVWHGDSPKNGLKNADTILIPIKEGEPKRLSLRPSDFVPFGPEIPGEWNPWGPDVIMLSLPPDRIGSIQAVGRSFYNLSQTRETSVQGIETLFLVGAPARRGTFSEGVAIPEMQAMLLWKATGQYLRLNAPNRMRENFDCIDLGVNTNAPFVAKRFNGVSGGGLWKVRIYQSEAGGFESFKTLIGVAYWQEPFEETELLMVRCHGRQAIETVLSFLPNRSASYGCPAREFRGTCGNTRRIPSDVLETQLLAKLQTDVFSSAAIDYVFHKLEIELSKHFSGIGDNLENMRRRKATLEAELKNLSHVVAGGMDSRSLRQAITEREAEIRTLTAKTLGCGKNSVHTQIRDLRKRVADELGDLRALLSARDNAMAMRMHLAKHVKEIELLPGDGGTIKYKGEWALLGNGDSLRSWDGAEGQNRTGYAGLFRAALYQ
jgi:hypothetical protein